ncbi:unnamed protein product [Symbiodinium sp. CCMP2592]|nr:unnamed protein product [Symbiodinium sp. CCMP2592]
MWAPHVSGVEAVDLNSQDTATHGVAAMVASAAVAAGAPGRLLDEESFPAARSASRSLLPPDRFCRESLLKHIWRNVLGPGAVTSYGVYASLERKLTGEKQGQTSISISV